MERYPWRGVLLALVGMVILLAVGTWLVDAAWIWTNRYEDPRYADLPGSCYWSGDARNYMRIALDGYSDYTAWLGTPHFTTLNDRSWWPLFPNLTGAVIRLGGGMCSGRTVNGIAFLALVPIFQALTHERRWWRLLALAVVPYGAWLYVGEADSLLLALSGLLVWVAGPDPPAWNRARGAGAFGIGILVGLAKPNGLVLLPALGVWALLLTVQHVRAESTGGARWRRALGDANPGWGPLLGGLGIVFGTAWWFYQTSGFYPYYVLLVQRTLWYREFAGGDPASFAYVFHKALVYARQGLLNLNELQRLIELSALVFGLALSLAHLPPRWPGGERILIPLHWRIGAISPFVLMFTSGQSHAVERYAVSNVFVVLVWYRVVFGAPGQAVTWRIRSFPGLLRWLWLVLGPVLWGLAFCLLGWGVVPR